MRTSAHRAAIISAPCVLAALVAEEDLLVAILTDPLANLVERVEDHIDIGPVGGLETIRGNPLDLRLRSRLAIMLLQQLPGFEDGPGHLPGRSRAPAAGMKA